MPDDHVSRIQACDLTGRGSLGGLIEPDEGGGMEPRPQIAVEAAWAHASMRAHAHPVDEVSITEQGQLAYGELGSQ